MEGNTGGESTQKCRISEISTSKTNTHSSKQLVAIHKPCQLTDHECDDGVGRVERYRGWASLIGPLAVVTTT